MIPRDIPKLLVVDKSIFHKFHDCDEKLCAFVKKYNVVFPHTLAIECVISEEKKDKEPDKLLRGLDKAVKAGGNIGYQSAELLKEEKTTLKPIKTIVNEACTKQIRKSTLKINVDLINHQAENYMKVTKRKIDELLKRAKRLCKVISENEGYTKLSRKLTKREERYQKWIQIMDHNNLVKNAMKTDFTEKISSRANANWYSWQYIRLWFAYCLDWSHKKSRPGSRVKKDISNDFVLIVFGYFDDMHAETLLIWKRVCFCRGAGADNFADAIDPAIWIQIDVEICANKMTGLQLIVLSDETESAAA